MPSSVGDDSPSQGPSEGPALRRHASAASRRQGLHTMTSLYIEIGAAETETLKNKIFKHATI